LVNALSVDKYFKYEWSKDVTIHGRRLGDVGVLDKSTQAALKSLYIIISLHC